MKKIQINKKQKIFYSVLGIIFLGGLYILNVCLPIISETSKVKNATVQLQNDINSVKKLILVNEKDIETKTLMSQKESNAIIELLVEAGRTKKVEFISMQIKDVVKDKGGGYKFLPIEIEALSSFENLGKFIHIVEQLSETKINIAELDIGRDEKILPLIVSDLKLEVYLKND